MIPSPWMDAIGSIGSAGSAGAISGIINYLGGDRSSSGNNSGVPWWQNTPWYSGAASAIVNAAQDPDSPLGSTIQDLVGSDDPSSNSLSTTGSGPGSSTAKEFEYYYADLARRYGMSRETAYNEAMANTAYQRAVADMQMAGLNPAVLFSASKASTAGSGYASGSSGGGFSSGKGASEDDQLPGWFYYGVSALAQVVGSVATKSFAGGMTASSVAQSLMKAWNGR